MKNFFGMILILLAITTKICAAPLDDALNPRTSEEILNEKISEINLIQNDKQKIIEWSKFNAAENYVIIDKKSCTAIILDNMGNEIKAFEVGIGKEIGDDFNDTLGIFGTPKNTTPAGEYTLIPNIFNIKAYGDLTFSLGGKASKDKNSKKVVALHKIPKFREKDRLQKFYDGNIKNNRMSHGCINFIEKDFNELLNFVKGGLKIYILPEENGNELILTKNEEAKYEFKQTKY